LNTRNLFREEKRAHWHIIDPFNKDMTFGIDPLTGNPDPITEMFFTCLAAFAQLERDMASGRILETQADMRARARKGEFISLPGSDPGWIVETEETRLILNGFFDLAGEPLSEYDPALDRQRFVDYICRLYAIEKLGCQRIGKRVNREYREDKSQIWLRHWGDGELWPKSTIFQIISSEALNGWRTIRKVNRITGHSNHSDPESEEAIPDYYPKAISEALYEQVRQRVELSREKALPNNGIRYLNLFIYCSQCAVCGEHLKMRGSTWWQRKRKWIEIPGHDPFPTVPALAQYLGLTTRVTRYRLKQNQIEWRYVDPPQYEKTGIRRTTLLCYGRNNSACANNTNVMYYAVEARVFEFLRSLDRNKVLVKTVPCVLDQEAVDNTRAEIKRWHNKIVSLEGDDDNSVVELVGKYKARKKGAQAKL
jgi:hypothetical protein